MSQVAMVIAAEENLDGMASASQFPKVVPLTIQAVDLYPIELPVGVSLSFNMVLACVLGSKTEVFDFDLRIPA